MKLKIKTDKQLKKEIKFLTFWGNLLLMAGFFSLMLSLLNYILGFVSILLLMEGFVFYNFIKLNLIQLDMRRLNK